VTNRDRYIDSKRRDREIDRGEDIYIKEDG